MAIRTVTRPARTVEERVCDVAGCEGGAERCLLCDQDACEKHATFIQWRQISPRIAEFLGLRRRPIGGGQAWTAFRLCDDCFVLNMGWFRGLGNQMD